MISVRSEGRALGLLLAGWGAGLAGWGALAGCGAATATSATTSRPELHARCAPLASIEDAPAGYFLEDDGAFPEADTSPPTEPFVYRTDEGLVVLVPPDDERDDATLLACPIPRRALGAELQGPDDPPWSAMRWQSGPIASDPIASASIASAPIISAARAIVLRVEGAVQAQRLYADVSRRESWIVVIDPETGLEDVALERLEIRRPLCWRGCGPFEGDDVIAREGRALEARLRDHPEEADGGAGSDVYLAERTFEATASDVERVTLRASPWRTHRERGFETLVIDDSLDLAPLGQWARP